MENKKLNETVSEMKKPKCPSCGQSIKNLSYALIFTDPRSGQSNIVDATENILRDIKQTLDNTLEAFSDFKNALNAKGEVVRTRWWFLGMARRLYLSRKRWSNY